MAHGLHFRVHAQVLGHMCKDSSTRHESGDFVQLTEHICSETSICIVVFKLYFIKSGTTDYRQVSSMFQFHMVFVIVHYGLACPYLCFNKHIFQLHGTTLRQGITFKYKVVPLSTG